MVSRNKGLFSQAVLFQHASLLAAILLIGSVYSIIIRPQALEVEIATRLQAARDLDAGATPPRSIFIILKDLEQQIVSTLFVWATCLLTFKLVQVGRERQLLNLEFVPVDPGERVIPEDALDRYKDLRVMVESRPAWRERLLPEVVLTALHRFQATQSIQEVSAAIKERTDLAADTLESDLSMIRYIAWAIPAIGFIGTVRGIGDALAQAEQAIRGDLSGVTASLGLAFNSTLVALVLSIGLMFMVHMLQSRQESLILEVSGYCREKVVGIMKTPEIEPQGGVNA
jgi:biopolymer transport protein ExbB/TolQ